MTAAQRWADDELRSLNAQIEYVLRDALRKAGRLPKGGAQDKDNKESP
nr:Arc family DNA binding domain-containing protein [Pseudoxanthomonas sp. PXM02]